MPWHFKAIKPIALALKNRFFPEDSAYGIRAFEYVKNGAFYKEKGLGRISLKEKSVRKWAYDSPENMTNISDREFGNFELWSPHWDKCSDAGNPPDIFLLFSNESMPTDKVKKAISGFMVLALADDFFTSKDAKKFVIEHILLNFNEPQAFYKHRAWAYSSNLGFQDSTQDFPLQGLFKDPIRAFNHAIDKKQFKEAWSAL